MAGQIIPLYPDSGTDAARVQGIPVSVVDPTTGQILQYDLATRQYVPVDYVGKAGGTFTGNLTLNGTANTAPNQTAASGSSLMTRDLVDARTLLELLTHVSPVIPIPARSFTNLGGGAGRDNQGWGYVINSGATAGAAGAYFQNNYIQNYTTALGFDYSQRVTMIFTAASDAGDASTYACVQFGAGPNYSRTSAMPVLGTSKGFGIKTSGSSSSNVVCFVSNGSSGAGNLVESSPVSVGVLQRCNVFRIVSDNGTVTFSYRAPTSTAWTTLWTTTSGPTGSPDAYSMSVSSAVFSGSTRNQYHYFFGGWTEYGL